MILENLRTTYFLNYGYVDWPWSDYHHHPILWSGLVVEELFGGQFCSFCHLVVLLRVCRVWYKSPVYLSLYHSLCCLCQAAQTTGWVPDKVITICWVHTRQRETCRSVHNGEKRAPSWNWK